MTESATPNFSLDLSNEVALVTGTTSGLGRRFAQILAACGAKVVLTGRRVERLNELADEIRADGGQCEPIAIDMTIVTAFVPRLLKPKRSLAPSLFWSTMPACLMPSVP
jgi:NADP-dependent 3-hydroxy acid dehydrogenase YdfG